MKKIIDIPSGTEEVEIGFFKAVGASGSSYINGGGKFSIDEMKRVPGISDILLPNGDRPMKRIIEVPIGAERVELCFLASVDDIAVDYPNGGDTFLVDELLNGGDDESTSAEEE